MDSSLYVMSDSADAVYAYDGSGWSTIPISIPPTDRSRIFNIYPLRVSNPKWSLFDQLQSVPVGLQQPGGDGRWQRAQHSNICKFGSSSDISDNCDNNINNGCSHNNSNSIRSNYNRSNSGGEHNYCRNNPAKSVFFFISYLYLGTNILSKSLNWLPTLGGIKSSCRAPHRSNRFWHHPGPHRHGVPRVGRPRRAALRLPKHLYLDDVILRPVRLQWGDVLCRCGKQGNV